MILERNDNTLNIEQIKHFLAISGICGDLSGYNCCILNYAFKAIKEYSNGMDNNNSNIISLETNCANKILVNIVNKKNYDSKYDYTNLELTWKRDIDTTNIDFIYNNNELNEIKRTYAKEELVTDSGYQTKTISESYSTISNIKDNKKLNISVSSLLGNSKQFVKTK